MKIETFLELTQKFQNFSELKKSEDRLQKFVIALTSFLFFHKSNSYEHVVLLCPKYTLLLME